MDPIFIKVEPPDEEVNLESSHESTDFKQRFLSLVKALPKVKKRKGLRNNEEETRIAEFIVDSSHISEFNQFRAALAARVENQRQSPMLTHDPQSPDHETDYDASWSQPQIKIELFPEPEYQPEPEVVPEVEDRNLFFLPKARDQTRDVRERLQTHHPYICNECGTQYKKKWELYRHLTREEFQIHIKICNFPGCNKRYNDARDLLRHQVTHMDKSERPKYQCDECKSEFFDKFYLKHHILMEKGLISFSCSLCPRRFNCQRDLTNHTRRSHNIGVTSAKQKPQKPRQICEVCGWEGFLAAYLEHMKKHSGNRVQCQLCPDTFHSEKNLRRHQRIKHHLGKVEHRCLKCNFNFPTFKEYNNHRVHTHMVGDFCCPICGKTFHNAKSFRDHKRTHNSSFYRCRECEMPFNSSADLTTHQKAEHINAPNLKRFRKCWRCKTTFDTVEELEEHRKVAHPRVLQKGEKRQHGGSQSFVCNLCQKGFRQMASLYRHRKADHRVVLGLKKMQEEKERGAESFLSTFL